MTRNETQEAAEHPPTPAPEAPDPLLMKQQQLKQQLQQTNKQIMDMRQQKTVIESMIQSANDRAQQIIGAIQILEEVPNLIKK